MAQTVRENPKSISFSKYMNRGLREGALYIFAAISVYFFISLYSYHPSDPGWSKTGDHPGIENTGGVAGAWIADVLYYLCGYWAYLVPVMIAYSGWLLYQGTRQTPLPGMAWLVKIAGFIAALTSGAGLFALHAHALRGLLPTGPGGVLGDLGAKVLVEPFSFTGATLFFMAAFLAGVTIATGLSWLKVVESVGHWTLVLWRKLGDRCLRIWDRCEDRWKKRQHENEYAYGAKNTPEPDFHVRIIDAEPVIDHEALETAAVEEKKSLKQRIEPAVSLLPGKKKSKPKKAKPKDKAQLPLFDLGDGDKTLPPLSMLDQSTEGRHIIPREVLETIERQIEVKLKDFGVDVEVVGSYPGPVVTRFELQLAPGLKVSKISNLAKDLARALSLMSVRIVEVIPGKPFVGLEIPNDIRETVRLREILQSKAYTEGGGHLKLALGKDISGQPAVVDLAKMPHLLVAGTTGSGKSVAINAMILSLLYHATPREVRLIFIDPKMLELSIYEGIPHLLAPVVTDMDEAANALRWCVAEMERRYRLMAALGVRNLGGFNRKVLEAREAGEPLTDPLYKQEPGGEPPPELETLPFIVVIIDELADMMMVVGKKVEELIGRLAQKARAAGIHLILATQRPSVDVITGLIKANIPTRIAFQVSSKIDSRTILDQMGAENLLGHGDMLYLAPGTGLPARVHGAFVDDHEVHHVVEFLKELGSPDYIEDVLTGVEEAEATPELADIDSSAESDPLYDHAVKIVTETRRASISGVQRRLKVGYNRAARMIETMEVAGIVGPLQSNGTREVLAPPPVSD